MNARAVVLLVAALPLAASAPAGAEDAWTKDISYDREPGPYAVGHWFDDTPEDGAEIPYSDGGYSVVASWSFPDDPRAHTGRSPAWTSEGYTVRFTRPDGGWTEARIADDATLLVSTSGNTSRAYEGYNFTRADFSRCTEAGEAGCKRYANDTRFATPVGFLAKAAGTYTFAVTVTDVDGGERTIVTSFSIVPRPPGRPEGLLALPTGPGTVEVSWQPPSDDGGLPVLRYVVWRGSEVVGNPAGTTFTDRGVPAGVHNYRVQAVSAVGAGDSAETWTAAWTLPGHGSVRVEASVGNATVADSAEW